MSCRAQLAALIPALGLGLPSALGCAPVPEGPHVLLLTVDTLRPDYMSRSGYDRPTTPALDALLARGTWFDGAIAPVPRTTPALASLLTGRYPHHHGVRRLFDSLDRDAVSIARVAQARGYRTIAVVSNHILTPKRGLDAGFDVYDHAGDGRIAAHTTRDALARLDAAGLGRPVLLWVHYIDPHMPYRPPERYAVDFDPGYRGRYRLHFGGPVGGVGNEAYPPDLPKRQAVYANPLPDEVNAHVRRLYAADLRQTDDAIAELLAGLEERAGNEWVVVFTADHGESLGEHDFFYDHGDYVYQPGLRVPLGFVDLRKPRPEPRVVPGWVSLVDVAPTLAEILGWPWEPVDGRSLAPALRGEPLEPRPVFAESGHAFFPDGVRRRVRFDLSGRFRAVLHDRHKLIYTPGLPAAEAWELYDLEADPGETRDLRQSERAPELARALREWMSRERGGPPGAAPSAEDLEALEALGYVEPGASW